jgi:signal peptidase
VNKLIKAIESAILIIFVLLLIYANVAYYFWKQFVIAVVEGYSMNPLLYEGDIVIILPSRNINLGDVVIFKNDRGEYVIHRVIGIINCSGKMLYMTKGDNNQFLDQVTFIAYRSSIECPTGKLATLQTGYLSFDLNIKRVVGNAMRGISEVNIAGKALQLDGVLIKISGLITR